MSSPFRRMRGIPDKTLNEALIDHRDVIGRLVRGALAQNRWNVGMVLMVLVAYLWLGALTFTPSLVGYVPLGGLSLLGAILVTRKASSYRLRRRIRAAQHAHESASKDA